MSSKLAHEAAWETSFLAFFSRQFLQTIPPIPSSISLTGQTALITGSNIGLGFECARQLLALGLARLIIAVRSQTKGDAAAELLRAEFPGAVIEVSILDMASYKSIVDFAGGCEKLDGLDIAVLNAGGSRPQFERAEETKHEMTFQVNCLSTALLASLLVPILKAKRGSNEPARLAIVGSDSAYWAPWKDTNCASVFDAVDNAASFDWMGAYKTSKLLLLMFAEKLSQRVSPEEVIINVPNPGACTGTAFGADNTSFVTRFMMRGLGRYMARTVETGARQYVDAVTVQGKESHGGFISEGRPKP